MLSNKLKRYVFSMFFYKIPPKIYPALGNAYNNLYAMEQDFFL